jgi:hypothetical protein
MQSRGRSVHVDWAVVKRVILLQVHHVLLFKVEKSLMIRAYRRGLRPLLQQKGAKHEVTANWFLVPRQYVCLKVPLARLHGPTSASRLELIVTIATTSPLQH